MSIETYLPAPERCERLEALLPRFGGARTMLSAGEAIEYAVPRDADDEVKDFLKPQSSVKIDPEFLARLPGGRVFGSGNVLAPDGRSLARDVSPDYGVPFEDHWLLHYKKIRPPVVIDGTVAVIATVLSKGYYHWLLEELPRALLLPSQLCTSIIGHTSHPFNREALALRQFKETMIEPKRYSHFTCEQLVVPSLVGQPGYPSLRAVRLLDEFTAPLWNAPVNSGEKLYISREKAARRKLANEPLLWAQLEARGFKKLHLEDMSWSEQINAFRSAKVIVAPHGAGLANLAFCAPQTRVIELFNRDYVNGCFWRLAALKGLDYRPLVSSGETPLAQNLPSNRLDIEIEIGRVLSACNGETS